MLHKLVLSCWQKDKLALYFKEAITLTLYLKKNGEKIKLFEISRYSSYFWQNPHEDSVRYRLVIMAVTDRHPESQCSFNGNCCTMDIVFCFKANPLKISRAICHICWPDKELWNCKQIGTLEKSKAGLVFYQKILIWLFNSKWNKSADVDSVATAQSSSQS